MHAEAQKHAFSSPAESWLRRRIGLDPESIGPAAIARAVRMRMEACGVIDEPAFLARLDQDSRERDRFIDEVVVPESWFFRDPQVFAFLQQFAVASAPARARRPFRILSVPCAAGEEPYSVAMALFEAGLAADAFSIDAADVSHAGLARAAAASYSANAFRTADLGFRDRWFRMEAGLAVLDDVVRRQVRFAWGNLLDEACFADRGPYDVVLCRNLLIYLTPDARAAAERSIDRLLAPGGLLVLGAAEPPILKGHWMPAASHAVFTLTRGTREPIPTGGGLPTGADTAPRRGPHRTTSLSAPSAASVPPARPTPANPPPQPTSAADVLRAAGDLANAGRRVEALALCERHEQSVEPTPELFFLMGLLHQAAGELERAEACLHKTLYLDCNHEAAIQALAAIAARRGDGRMAERYRQSAARVRARRESS